MLDESAVILDLTETSLERIIHTILNKMLDNLNAPLAYEEAMSTLFLPESGNILAKTIQVIELTCLSSCLGLSWSQYWLFSNQWDPRERSVLSILIDRAQSGSTEQFWRTTSLG